MSANQSRRRTDSSLGTIGSTNQNIDSTLPYLGRELDENSTRLIEIEPAARESDPVVCKLIEVTFASRPKFEALSYMWGTERADEAITLDGFPFEVRGNLLDALRFLRRQVASGKARQPFWIDAISINQSNVQERNRQVRIMDQIYFRACTVVVWLGSGYTKFQGSMIRELEPEKGENGEQNSSQGSNSTQQEMVRYLRTDPYWDRLWIIQEIGSANMLRVCFGNESSSWEQFMDFIAMHNSDGATGPLRLNRLLRQEKYNDSHTLKKLLEEHREAKCSEPRDKVYGLVGLASDAAQFPMDYSKSLYEVWKDTMVFMNCWGLFREESQILPIGALVKSLLMANHSDPLSQISRDHEDRVDSTQLIDNPNSVFVFNLKAVVLGCIIHVGPLAIDIISKPSEALDWRSATQRLFPANERGSAHWEHDRLLRALLESDESEIEMTCFNRPSVVIWEAHNDSEKNPKSARDYVQKFRGNTGTIASTLPLVPQHTTDRLSSVQPRLYLAKSWAFGTERKMGIASGLVQPGDLVCWVRSSKRALLGRVIDQGSWNFQLRVFGTALATEDVCRSAPDYAQRWNSLKNEWSMEVQLDLGTVFMLLD